MKRWVTASFPLNLAFTGTMRGIKGLHYSDFALLHGQSSRKHDEEQGEVNYVPN